MNLDVTITAWLLTVGGILALFAFDLVIGFRRKSTVEFREATFWSIFYIALALCFGLGFGIVAGWDFGTEYFTGYLVEKSLSVDNLFVFVIILAYFNVPKVHQQKVLTFGILGALFLRAILIAIGAALISLFTFTFLLFGLLLIVTAIQLFRHRDQDPSVEDNPVVNLAKRVFPVTEEYEEGKLVTRRNGKRMWTPMFLVLLAVGTTDLLFALDSIPAIFGITQEAYIVFVANAFALLGLRALYFLVVGLLDRLVYLSTGLSLILGYIGFKLVLKFAHELDNSIPEIPIGISLGVIVVILTATTIASLIRVKRDPQARAHAGALRTTAERGESGEQSG